VPLSQGQHERHLSETSSATIELTRACPLGESQNQPLEMMNDFHHSQVPTSNGKYLLMLDFSRSSGWIL